MNDFSKKQFTLPPEQQAIREKCFHPSGRFVEFPVEDVETSIPARLERIRREYPNNLAVLFGDQEVAYPGLNAMTNRFANVALYHTDPRRIECSLWPLRR